MTDHHEVEKLGARFGKVPGMRRSLREGMMDCYYAEYCEMHKYAVVEGRWHLRPRTERQPRLYCYSTWGMNATNLSRDIRPSGLLFSSFDALFPVYLSIYNVLRCSHALGLQVLTSHFLLPASCDMFCPRTQYVVFI